MSQRARVLTALRHAGPTGLTSIDFLLPQVCDRGKPITRLAARIQDLRDEGYSIDSSGTRHGVAVYVLREQTVSSEPASPPAEVGCAGSDEAATLFDPVEVHPGPRKHWEETAA